MDFTNIQENISEIEQESKIVAQIIRKLEKMEILHSCPEYLLSAYDDDSWLGYVKYQPRKGDPAKHGWDKTFVPVVKIKSNDVVVWHHRIKDPGKLLNKLIEKYREKNSKVVEVSKAHPFLLEEAKEEKKEIAKPMIIGGFHVEIGEVNSHADESSD
jgi:hypothetical protein